MYLYYTVERIKSNYEFMTNPLQKSKVMSTEFFQSNVACRHDPVMPLRGRFFARGKLCTGTRMDCGEYLRARILNGRGGIRNTRRKRATAVRHHRCQRLCRRYAAYIHIRRSLHRFCFMQYENSAKILLRLSRNSPRLPISASKAACRSSARGTYAFHTRAGRRPPQQPQRRILPA